MTGPIMLTAGPKNGGRGDSGDKRLSKPIIKKSPLKDDLKTSKHGNRPEVLESDSDLSDSAYDPLDRTIQNRSNALTAQSREESDRMPQRGPPRKPNLVIHFPNHRCTIQAASSTEIQLKSVMLE